MRAFYLSLAALALSSFDLTEAAPAGLLRERQAARGTTRELQAKSGKMGGKMSKSSSSSAVAPSCPAPESSSSKSGKMGGKMGKSKSGDTRFLLEDLEDERFLQSRGGKMSSSGKMGKSKGSSGGDDGDCDCDPPTDLCPETTGTIDCYGPDITEDTIISTPLACDAPFTGQPRRAIVTVVGATLECTGDMDNMIYSAFDSSSTSVCVVLRDGATLKNCYVYNCNTGVFMQGEGNNRVVGGYIFGTNTAIETANTGEPGLAIRPNPDNGDTGCYSVECTTIVGNGEGIMAQHNGEMIISNTEILGTSGSGIAFAPHRGNTLSGVIDDTNIFGLISDGTQNFRGDGIRIGQDGGARCSRSTPAAECTYGTVPEIAFYGDVKIINSQYGLVNYGDLETDVPVSIEVFGNLDSFDSNLDSYNTEGSTLVLQEDSSITACTFGVDGDGASFTLRENGFLPMGDFTLVCEGDDADPPGCPSGECPDAITEALTCSGDDVSVGKSKSGGKMNGGKMNSSKSNMLGRGP